MLSVFSLILGYHIHKHCGDQRISDIHEVKTMRWLLEHLIHPNISMHLELIPVHMVIGHLILLFDPVKRKDIGDPILVELLSGPYPHTRSPIQFVIVTPALQWIWMLVGTCQMFVSSLWFCTMSTIDWLSSKIHESLSLCPLVCLNTWS
jgi:hypothetical protein